MHAYTECMCFSILPNLALSNFFLREIRLRGLFNVNFCKWWHFKFEFVQLKRYCCTLCKYIEFGATLMARFVCFHVLNWYHWYHWYQCVFVGHFLTRHCEKRMWGEIWTDREVEWSKRRIIATEETIRWVSQLKDFISYILMFLYKLLFTFSQSVW